MKRTLLLFAVLLCMMLTSCDNLDQNSSYSVKDINQTLFSGNAAADTLSDSMLNLEEIIIGENDKQAYIKAYTDFLLNSDIDEGSEFPIWGYYLFDLNFDYIPELGVLHDSGGSMGGYFTYYCFNGKEIVPVLNEKNEPAVGSNYTQILADYENKKVYMLKEMWLLKGNENGTYGYIREIINQNGIPCVYDILKLDVNQESDLENHYWKSYIYEDDYLSDSELDKFLITQQYSGSGWKEISSGGYLKLKRELIPGDNNYADLRNDEISILLCGSVYELMDEDGEFINKRAAEEEIEMLFSKWLEYVEQLKLSVI